MKSLCVFCFQCSCRCRETLTKEVGPAWHGAPTSVCLAARSLLTLLMEHKKLAETDHLRVQVVAMQFVCLAGVMHMNINLILGQASKLMRLPEPCD